MQVLTTGKGIFRATTSLLTVMVWGDIISRKPRQEGECEIVMASRKFMQQEAYEVVMIRLNRQTDSVAPPPIQ